MRTLTFALSLFWTIIFLINCNQSLAIVNGTRGYGVNGYQGVVLIYPNGGKPVGTEVQVCQGALISRIHVLTVKTCCDERIRYTVVIGSTTMFDDKGEIYDVVNFRTEETSRIYFPYTPCLMQLSREVQYSSEVAPYVMATAKDFRGSPNIPLTGFGYGATEIGTSGYNLELQSLSLPFVDIHKCRSIYDTITHYDQERNKHLFLCLGYTDRLTRMNIDDVGGPIVHATEYKLMGLLGYEPAVEDGKVIDPTRFAVPTAGISLGNDFLRRSVLEWMTKLS